MTDIDFEFKAPQFIESWENAANIYDGADNFFDALESLEGRASHENEESVVSQQFKIKVEETTNTSAIDTEPNKEDEESNVMSTDAKTTTENEENNSLHIDSKQDNKFDEEIENINAISKHDENALRRLSLKRKASPLKDKNEYVPPKCNQESIRKFKKKPAFQILPTVPESPVLLTKARVRPQTATKIENREILKPVRKKNIGVCLKPLPKPPTVPVPFNLTEPGKNVHHCTGDDTEKSSSLITPNKNSIKKKKLEGTPNNSDLRGRIQSGSELSTKKKVLMNRNLFQEKNGATTKEKQMEFKPEKMQELEDNLFVFKARPVPNSNSSFISTASSSKRNFFDTSLVSTISSKASDMPFSFYERDKELLQRKKERMNQVETIKQHTFKAKEPSVLKKDPFWPELESRSIQIDFAPDLATNKRAEERKIMIEEQKKKRAITEEILMKELKKAHEEEIRKIRKTMEFKATAIRK